MDAFMTLPAKYYTDPAVFREEMERFFFNQWVCVGRTDAIPEPGDYFLREVAGERLIVVRGEDRKPRAFFNHCRHRGTELCQTESGKFPGRILCPYHGWSYNLEGELIGAPHMAETPGFSLEKFPLHAAPCESWDGNLFAYVGGRPSLPLAEQLDGLIAKFRPWRMEELRSKRRIIYSVKANWKLIVLNYNECLHCPLVHPALQKLSDYKSGANEEPREHWVGGVMSMKEGVENLTMDGKMRRPYFPHLGESERRSVHYYWISPNVLLSLAPDYVMLHTLWPKAHDLTEIQCEWLFHPEAIARKDFDPDDAVKLWDITNREDWHVSELSQRGMASRAYEPGPYSMREKLLHGFDQIVAGRIHE